MSGNYLYVISVMSGNYLYVISVMSDTLFTRKDIPEVWLLPRRFK
jgi:hypothetical protein